MGISFLIYLAPVMYALSIFVDIFTYHLKFNVHDSKNYRYLFSLISVFQYTARGFILIFAPIMAYFTETVKDKHLIWAVTLIAHITVIFFLLPLYNRNFSRWLSQFLIKYLNKFLGKGEFKKSFVVYIKNDVYEKEKFEFRSDVSFFLISLLAFIVFSFSITFLYYITFYYPENILMLSTYSQLFNTIGAISILLFIDPRFMLAIDNNKGLKQLNIITSSRIVAHLLLIFILLVLQ